MMDPVQIWTWDDAPKRLQERVGEPVVLDEREDDTAIALVPNHLLDPRLATPSWIKALWRRSSCVRYYYVEEGMLVAWNIPKQRGVA